MGFSPVTGTHFLMPRPPRRSPRLIASLRRAFCASVFAAISAASLFANSSHLLRSMPAGSCYCCCNESRAAAGCAKMCELPKYASRWWATTCAKPHVRRPAASTDAGPHLRRPDRATYAQLQLQAN